MWGKTIRDLRLAFGWSQMDLAKKLSVSKQTVSNWENSNIQPSVDILIKLSNVFSVNIDYLLGLDNIPRLSLDGLSTAAVAHIAALVEDLRQHSQEHS